MLDALYAEFRNLALYSERQYAERIMLSVVMMSVVALEICLSFK
jgi:hypothetical protein